MKSTVEERDERQRELSRLWYQLHDALTSYNWTARQLKLLILAEAKVNAAAKL
jgi:hypothetical protein